MEIKTINTEDLLKDLKRLNEFEIKKFDNGEERLIFKNSNEVFKIFSNPKNEEGLNPFNNRSYDWLNSFISHFIDNYDEKSDLKENLNDFEENLSSYIDGDTDIYNSDLLKWLSDGLNNMYYMEEVAQEGLISLNRDYDFCKHLQIAQYKAIENAFYSFLESLKDYLSNKYEIEL
jgi:hypothetical protein